MQYGIKMTNSPNKKTVRPLSPLQAIAQGASFDISAKISSMNNTERFDGSVKAEEFSSLNILSVSPHKICNWKFKDRAEFEKGNLDSLANDLKENGQVHPCIVRPNINSSEYEYELIVGERRHLAAKLAGIKLLVIVENLSDKEAAIKQISENLNRKDLSEFSVGMNFFSLVNKNILSTKELEQKLNFSRLQVSRLLSFGHVPNEIWEAIGNPSKVSARTASEIRTLSNKGKEYIEAILSLAPKIRAGKMGANTLSKEVNNLISNTKLSLEEFGEVRSSNGRHLFTWRKDTNNNISISFPKDIRELIDKKSLEIKVKDEIENQLNTIIN
jgi:ParB family chromosome partitioning protein